jgi:curli biogenesis system outer membrane secretion channel CsgG
MKKYALMALTCIIGVSFLGCSAKVVTIKAQQPAEVDTLTKKRDLAVIPFKNDNVNFSGRLETKLANVRIKNKPYFKVVNRDRIGSVLRELKFQSSDLVGKKAAKLGKLAGAQVLITGNIKTSKKDGSYKKPEQRCDSYTKHGCAHYTTAVSYTHLTLPTIA